MCKGIKDKLRARCGGARTCMHAQTYPSNSDAPSLSVYRVVWCFETLRSVLKLESSCFSLPVSLRLQLDATAIISWPPFISCLYVVIYSPNYLRVGSTYNVVFLIMLQYSFLTDMVIWYVTTVQLPTLTNLNLIFFLICYVLSNLLN